MAKKRTNKLIYILAVILVLLVAFLLIGKSLGWIGGENAKEVVLAKAKFGEITEKVSASGKIQPEVEIKIAPEVSGEITNILINDGDSVKKGQLLLRIRPDRIQTVLDQTIASYNNMKAMAAQAKANLGRAKAQFEQVELAFKRNQDLYKQKVISLADFQKAESEFNVAKQDLESAKQNLKAADYSVISAEARVKEAQENLSLTQIFAPEGGIISKLNVEEGERVVGTSQMAGTELLSIANLKKMEVRVDVNENDIIRVSIGDTAIIDVDSYSQLDRKFKGVITEIANTANPTTSPDAVTEFEVRIRILEESFDYLQKEHNIAVPFRPGMTASVDIITERKDKTLMVPLSSVTTRSGNKDKAKEDKGNNEDGRVENVSYKQTDKSRDEEMKEVVFVKKGEKVEMREVKTGISDYDNIEIISGLKSGEEIVSGPFLAVSKQLNDGDLVTSKKENNK